MFKNFWSENLSLFSYCIRCISTLLISILIIFIALIFYAFCLKVYINIKNFFGIPHKYKTDYGDVWILNNKYHREDGPAIDYINCKEWFLHGLRHREDGPAVEHGDYSGWYLYGIKHREDGPAIKHRRFYKEYYIHGVRYTEGEYKKYLNFKLKYSKPKKIMIRYRNTKVNYLTTVGLNKMFDDFQSISN